MSDHEIVRVVVHEADGRVYARSKDLPGLILSDDNWLTLVSIVPAAIEALYRYEGFSDVKVTAGSSSPNIAAGPGPAFRRYNVELFE
jgi:hypothetical protein